MTENETIPEIAAEDRIAVQIPMGSSTTQIAGILKESGVITNELKFKLYSNINGYDGLYKSGTHLVSNKLEYDEIMRILISNPTGIKITIPEGYSYSQIIDKLAKEKLIDKNKFIEVSNNEKFEYKFINNIAKRDNRYEGYLFPDTYEFDIKAGEKEIINRMLRNFEAKLPSNFSELAKARGRSMDEIITIASIIEREAKDKEERRLISGVFYNRLSGKYSGLKKLESCATIQYVYLNRMTDVAADIKTRIMKGIVLDADKKLEDKYNTYKYEGLPPGPICSPGKDSILAALSPEKTDYLYFIANGEGKNDFSKTLAEHQAKMKKYGLVY
jgi:UPF0755 protein